MKNPHGLIANLSQKQSSKFYLRKMTLVNVKTKQDLIKLKKNLIKRAEEEKLKDFNHDANLEKLYKPIVEPLKQIVSETKETKKLIEGINGIPAILEKRAEPLAIKDVPISLHNFGPIATKYLTHIFSKKGDHDTTYGLKLDEESKAFRLGRENIIIDPCRKEVPLNIR